MDIRRSLDSIATGAALLTAVLFLPLSAEARSTPRGSTITGRVTISGPLAPNLVGPKVTFRLLSVEPKCCDDCKPNACTRVCCEPGAKLVKTIEKFEDGEFKFEGLPSGRYLLVNDAGYEQFITLGENEKFKFANALDVTLNAPSWRNPVVHPGGQKLK